jgi:hypothetical protein
MGDDDDIFLTTSALADPVDCQPSVPKPVSPFFVSGKGTLWFIRTAGDQNTHRSELKRLLCA